MHRRLIAAAIAAGLLGSLSRAAAGERITIPILDAPTLTLSCDRVLEEARTKAAELEKLPLDQASTESVLDAWDRNSLMVEDVVGPVAILNNVHPDKKVRDAADACLLKVSSFSTELYQNESLFKRVAAVKPSSPEARQLQKDLLENFEDSGVALPAEKRKRFKEIDDLTTELGLKFAKNLRDNQTKLTFTPEECKGLPKSYVDRVSKDAAGNIVVGFDYPDYIPFMENSESAEARRRFYIANTNRGGAENLEILDRLVALRKELAGLYGLGSFAEYVTRRRMVENPATVLRFLDEVAATVKSVEERDVAELRRFRSERTGVPLAETRIDRWDVAYYSARLKESRYKIDQEELRKYFPAEPVIRWLLSVSENLYGIRFEKATVPLWHEDARYYDVKDAASGDFLGGLYLDLYPRDGKFKHAAAWGVRHVSRKANRTPISVLVTNLDRRGLTQEELRTFFHEFGHALHGVLSKTAYGEHGGTSVQRDFVEAPSQMFEEWTRRYESLKTLHASCPECPPIDPAMVDRLNAARRFGSGLQYSRQWLYAAYDMSLAGPEPGKAIDVWEKMEGATPLGHIPGSSFPGTFEHIARGYAAGYYGYMWSEVIALDMLSAFGDDIMNPAVGKRFRELILSRGGEEPARQLVEKFLGRPVSNKAFLAEITGTRK